jgi:hypothetical protein
MWHVTLADECTICKQNTDNAAFTLWS